MGAKESETNSTQHDAAAGLSVRPTAAWPAARAETLIALWNAGRSTAQIATRLDVSVAAVEGKLRTLRAAGHDLVRRRAAAACIAARRSQASIPAIGFVASTWKRGPIPVPSFDR